MLRALSLAGVCESRAHRLELMDNETSFDMAALAYLVSLVLLVLTEFIGEMGLFFAADQRAVVVRTRSACELAEINYERLHQLFAGPLQSECPRILYAIGLQLSKRLLDTSRKASRLAFMDVSVDEKLRRVDTPGSRSPREVGGVAHVAVAGLVVLRELVERKPAAGQRLDLLAG